MLDRITAFFQRIGQAVGRGIGLLVAWLVWPFMAAHGWYGRRHWMVKGPILALLVLLVGLYGYFIWQTQVWSGFNPNFVESYRWSERTVPAGQELPAEARPGDAAATTTSAARQCQSSALVDASADLIDMNVNQNAWISSMLLYRLGFFGIDWDHTPFLDNKASFQRGVHQAVRRTSAELVDTLGRVRGTSGINSNLQDARGNLQFDEYSWYFGLDPFGFKTPSPAYYRTATEKLRAFNADLTSCNATFDTRADNLIQFVDRIANDLGGTAAILRERSENNSAGWFDTRADDRFWFAYGQLYGYYAVLSGAGADFSQVIRERNLGPLWAETLARFRSALRVQPAIVSNGSEDGLIMPSHLAVMGFHTLMVRSNLVEVRSVLDR
ncbi:hypothetical protein EDE05_103194 [Neorhizobium sp. R1-B]|uniref:DUF2333 family protein n=1 Tax=unclassified Neorhizobium TaxID=2629175 RepID=UPI001050927C|nr:MULTISPECIES: DUF2333 family protein [unclassified Neorhizobium]TCV74439.1 hypothetical protein EDE09_102194 [Neorhizobium sp. S3-V5DH]TDX87625.1 hypothetical protein EDE05_103194 [Neorhizobium sp. R1-B]